MRKQFIHCLGFLFLCLSQAGCSQEDSLPPGADDKGSLAGQPVCFNALTVEETGGRAAVPLADGSTMTVTMTAGSATRQADYVYQSGKWEVVKATGNTPLCWQDATTQHSFTAVSPALTAEEKKAGNRSSFTLPAVFSSSNFSSYDFMETKAAVSATPSEAPTILLSFERKMVRIEITFTARKEVKIYNAKTSSASNDSGEITLWGNNTTYCGCLLPGQTFGTGDNNLKIIADGALYALSSGGTLTTKAGEVIKINLTTN